MTNIATLFALDSEIPYLLKQLVLMCGVFTTDTAGVARTEWNAVCDPHAAAMVYKSPVACHRSIGLDVTMRVSLSKQEVLEKFSTNVLMTVRDFASIWFEKADRMTFHDPLAAVAIFDPDVCTFEKGTVEMELTSERCMGMIYWQANKQDGKHEVALDVDVPRFFEHYFSTVV